MDDTTRLSILKKAIECRLFEEKVFELIQKGVFEHGAYYLSAGQELIPTCFSQYCLINGIKPLIFAQHRAHSWYISFEGSLEKLRDELLGKTTGCASGMGGSASIHCPEINMYGHDGLMGSQVPIAVGACLGTNKPTICIMGDAAAEEDYVMSSIAWASHKSLPIWFVIEDNNLSILTEKKVRRNWSMVDFAKSVGMESYELADSIDELYPKLASLEFNKPILFNVSTERLFWHAGAGIDPYQKIDRLSMELEKLDPALKSLYDRTKKDMETLWKI